MKKILIIFLMIFLVTGCSFDKEVNEKEKNVVNNKESSKEVDKNVKITDELSVLGKKIVKTDKMQSKKKILKKYVEESVLDINTIYFSSTDGEFIIIPEIDLPPEFDFHKRDAYKKAINQEIYISEPYKDVSNNKNIITNSIKIEYKDEVEGVLGIDYYTE